MNIDLNSNSNLTKECSFIMAPNGFRSLLDKPTRVTINFRTCINHIYVRARINTLKYNADAVHLGIII